MAGGKKKHQKTKTPGSWAKLVQISCYLLIRTLHILTRNAEKRFHIWPEFMHEHMHNNKSDKEQGFFGANPNKNITGMEKSSRSMSGFGMISLQLPCSLPFPFSLPFSNASINHLQLTLCLYMFVCVQNEDGNINREQSLLDDKNTVIKLHVEDLKATIFRMNCIKPQCSVTLCFYEVKMLERDTRGYNETIQLWKR